jgi:hypothetical protein
MGNFTKKYLFLLIQCLIIAVFFDVYAMEKYAIKRHDESYKYFKTGLALCCQDCIEPCLAFTSQQMIYLSCACCKNCVIPCLMSSSSSLYRGCSYIACYLPARRPAFFRYSNAQEFKQRSLHLLCCLFLSGIISRGCIVLMDHYS